MRLFQIVAIAWLAMGVASSALAQHPNGEEGASTDARRSHPRMHPMDRGEDGQDRFPRRRAHMREMRERYRNATPEQRLKMRAERMERMESFEGGRGRRHGVLAEMSHEERAALREEVEALPDEERHQLRRKLRHFHALPDEEQAELKQRFGALRSLDSAEQQHIEHNTERWKQMDPDRRAELRETWKRFRELPPDVQQSVLDKALSEAGTDPDER